ncbi:uncharacterized protein LOC142973312 [Anticarsia gemmatalis]|uniref:uncharacterized protein LOC142973312 n=1 Tax=Anticarsia gemmatalis TaxID=129554 RepID=UPI003F76A4E3
MLKTIILFVLLSVVFDGSYGKFVYREDIGGWIKVFKVVANYSEASAQCRDREAVLASPITEELILELKTIIAAQKHPTSYLLGTMARDSPNSFVSEEGVALEDMPEMDFMDKLNPDYGRCLAMSKDRVHVVPCSSKLPYICYVKRAACNLDYTYLSESRKCYKFYITPATWSDASNVCKAEGAHLVVINDRSEMNALWSFTGYQSFFVGLSQTGGGNWMSVTGQPVEDLYNLWYYGYKPSDDALFCGSIESSQKLFKADCNTAMSFMCESSINYIDRKVIFHEKKLKSD